MKITIRLTYILILVITTNIYLYSQSPKIDSSLQELRLKTDDKPEEKANLIQFIASTYIYENLDSSLVWSNKLLAYAQEMNLPKEEAKAYQFLANYYKANNQLDTSLVLIDQGLDILKKHKEHEEFIALLSFKGNILFNIPRYSEAEACYLRSLELAKSQNDTMMIGINLHGLGNISDYTGKYEEAIEYHLESLNYFQVLQDSFHMSDAYSNIGVIFYLMRDFEKAIDYTWKAIAIKKSMANTYGLYNSYSNLYVFYSESGQLDSAEIHLDTAQLYAESYGSEAVLHNVIGKKASLNMGKENFDLAFEQYYETYIYYKKVNSVQPLIHATLNVGKSLAKQNKYKEAIPYFKESVGLSKQNNYLHGEERGTRDLIFGFLALKDYEKVSSYVPNYLKLKDSLLNSEKQKTISELELKFETEQKEKENIILKRESEIKSIALQKHKLSLWITGLLLVVASLLVWILFKANQLKRLNNLLLVKEKNSVETLHLELAHRIKNNLLFMSTLLKMQSKRAERQETQLAIKESELRLETMAILHSKLDHQSDGSSINLKEYLNDLVENLILTFPKRINTPSVSLSIKDFHCDGDQAIRIGLIVNELITNSLKHAFENFEIINPEININLREGTNQEFILVYSDNGIGIKEDFITIKQESLGLKLIRSLTDQLNGHYTYSSEEGSVFTFSFKPNIHLN